ncbi:DUF5677 domain-containing protein [Pseudomonas sp. P3C3]
MVQGDTDKDRQSLVDKGSLGAEPSEHYLERVQALDNVIRECMHVSQSYAGIRSPSGRHYYASVLFTALITRSVSLANLVPHTPWASKLIEHWDYASVAGITRTILELRLAFFYLCAEPCSDEEWDCRWNIFNLHDCTSRRRMFESLPSGADQLPGFDAQAEELRDRLRNNTFFQSLPPKKQKSLLHGQTAYIMPLEDIGERVGVEKETFRWLYVLLSSHVHGLPMSFYRISSGEEERGRGLPSETEEGYTSLCLSFVVSLIVGARDELHNFFSNLIPERPEQSNLHSAPPAEASPSTSKFYVGETRTIFDNGDTRLEATRDSDTSMSIIVFASETPVLRRRESEDEEASLEWFDPFYWSVTIDELPATEKLFTKLKSTPHAFRVDIETRTLLFKTK